MMAEHASPNPASSALLLDFCLCLVSLAVLGLFPATGWALFLLRTTESTQALAEPA